MECLDKMTNHSIADDKLFEPIPLSPQTDRAYMTAKKAEAAAAATELFRHNPTEDDSERDEFAEG
jgi:hypothetical protein